MSQIIRDCDIYGIGSGGEWGLSLASVSIPNSTGHGKSHCLYFPTYFQDLCSLESHLELFVYESVIPKSCLSITCLSTFYKKFHLNDLSTYLSHPG
jgi:hypothetical protein